MPDIKQYVFPYIVDANMYIITEGKETLVIDPHYSREAEKTLRSVGAENVVILLTHEHFDHTCGIPWFRSSFDVFLVCQKNALNAKMQRTFNRAACVTSLYRGEGADELRREIEMLYPPYTFSAEKTFEESFAMEWAGHNIVVKSVPGHSPASCLIYFDDSIVFTGDSLIPDHEPTLRWPYSDEAAYYKKTLPVLKSLPSEKLICPGHGKPAKMKNLRYDSKMFVSINENGGRTK